MKKFKAIWGQYTKDWGKKFTLIFTSLFLLGAILTIGFNPELWVVVSLYVIINVARFIEAWVDLKKATKQPFYWD